MPELPEVETVRRMLEGNVVGRTVRAIRLSGQRLRSPISPVAVRRLRRRRIDSIGRHGKYLFLHFDGGHTLLSHLGMSGRWLFSPSPPDAPLPHVHARFEFEDRSSLRYQDPRRFGLLRVVSSDRLGHEPELRSLGPDPIANGFAAEDLAARARGRRVAVKAFLLDQRQLAGIGNIYASEILHRARVHPSRAAGRIVAREWNAIARSTRKVLLEAIARSGTTFSMYRTLWNEPGQYGEQLRVYDRGGQPCRDCGTAIRRVVLGQRSTFFCPSCQPRVTTKRKK